MSVHAEPENAVRQLVESFVDAWNVHGARAFARVFADDADFTNVFGMHARGRETIEQFHRPIFQTIFKDSRLAAIETTVRFIRPDVAAVDVRWEMTGARDPMGKEWPLRRGLINLTVVRESESWSIVVMHNMDLPAEEMAQAQAKIQSGAAGTAP
jgi:uncharacterized protein (TIGR02246 family)